MHTQDVLCPTEEEEEASEMLSAYTRFLESLQMTNEKGNLCENASATLEVKWCLIQPVL